MIQIKDKEFKLYISEEEIRKEVYRVASQINADYENRKVIFIGVLNGAFMFAADLIKEIHLDCEISFIRVKSYLGTTSTKTVHEILGLTTDLKDKHIIILEDIVDTGLTLSKLYSLLENYTPATVEVATMLFKPNAFEGTRIPKYIGMEIENKFIVGHGLDYLEEGRNLKDIYQIIE